MDERGQFTFYRSFWEAVKGLPKKDKLPILESIISYALDGIEPSGLTQSQFAFFLLVKPTLDSSRKKAASGKQGGKTLKANGKQNESKPQANHKQTVTESEKEKEKEIEIEGEKEKDKEQTASTLLAPYGGGPSLPDRPQKAPAHAFTAFWEAYPKKIDREAAWNAWKDLNPSPDTANQVLASLGLWKKSSQWTEDGDRFIPTAAKFLAKGYWQSPPVPGTGKRNTVPKGASGKLGAAEIENIRRLMQED